jgi:hypothetical protein
MQCHCSRFVPQCQPPPTILPGPYQHLQAEYRPYEQLNQYNIPPTPSLQPLHHPRRGDASLAPLQPILVPQLHAYSAGFDILSPADTISSYALSPWGTVEPPVMFPTVVAPVADQFSNMVQAFAALDVVIHQSSDSGASGGTTHEQGGQLHVSSSTATPRQLHGTTMAQQLGKDQKTRHRKSF